MLFGGLAVVVDAIFRNRRAALFALIAVYAVSLASELMGTGWGVPFGPYSYTSLLGPKWFELVPLLIPLSWFTMSWVCWTLARQHRSGVRAVLIATVLLVSWDLLLDPAMSKVTSYWVWGETGSYYGMPWTNLFGWGVTGLVLFVILNKMAARPRTTVSFAMAVYAINFALPLGFCILNQYWMAVGAGVGSLLLGLFACGLPRSDNAQVGFAAKNPGLQKL
jgi:putative membrane protein